MHGSRAKLVLFLHACGSYWKDYTPRSSGRASPTYCSAGGSHQPPTNTNTGPLFVSFPCVVVWLRLCLSQNGSASLHALQGVPGRITPPAAVEGRVPPSVMREDHTNQLPHPVSDWHCKKPMSLQRDWGICSSAYPGFLVCLSGGWDRHTSASLRARRGLPPGSQPDFHSPPSFYMHGSRVILVLLYARPCLSRFGSEGKPTCTVESWPRTPPFVYMHPSVANCQALNRTGAAAPRGQFETRRATIEGRTHTQEDF